MKLSAVPLRVPDIALTARLEGAHAWAVQNYVSCLQCRRPQLGAAGMAVSGGYAFYTGPSPFSFAVGLGLDGAVSAEQLDDVEQFYSKRGVPTKVDITPATHSSLSELTRSRAYRIADLTSVLILDLEQELQAHQVSPDVELRWANSADCDVWVDMLARHFFAAEPGEQRRQNIACMFHAPNALNLIATIDGQVAGVAGCMIPHDGSAAVIYGSCTVPEFRCRGVHREMLRARLQTARAAGCDIAMATALPGSDSERNLERCGFEICYVKTAWTNG